jgi:hypothetical protein
MEPSGVWVVKFSAKAQAEKHPSVVAKPYAGAPASHDSLKLRRSLRNPEHGTHANTIEINTETTNNTTESICDAYVDTSRDQFVSKRVFVRRVCENEVAPLLAM